MAVVKVCVAVPARGATGGPGTNELAREFGRLKAAVSLGDLIEGDPLGDTRTDGTDGQ